MAWIKSLLINIVVVTLSVALTLVLVELVLHATPLKLKYLYPLEPGGYLHWDAELGFDITKNFATSTHAFTDLTYPVWSNSMGCFDYAYDGTSPSIYVTGDSFTWGFTPLQDKWGKKIEQDVGVRTLTCGVNAYGTRQELIKTSRDLARLTKTPELIVVGFFGGNDLGDDFAYPNFTAYKGYRVLNELRCDPETVLNASPLEATTTCTIPEPHYGVLKQIKFWLSLHSILYMMAQREGIQDKLKDLLHRFAPTLGAKSGLLGASWPNTDDSEDLAWQIQTQDFLAFKTLADKYHTKLLVVLIPDRNTVRVATSTPNPEWVNEKAKALQAKMRAQQTSFVHILAALG